MPFTLNVLCNHEVIDVDQDPLGHQARIVRQTDSEFVLAKDLEDGSKAVGLFNLTDHGRTDQNGMVGLRVDRQAASSRRVAAKRPGDGGRHV